MRGSTPTPHCSALLFFPLALGLATGCEALEATCSVVVDDGPLMSATVWDECATYEVPRGLRVMAPLEIAPGTTVHFGSGATLAIETAGSLSALGTAEAPIVFEGSRPNPDFWGGISIRSNSPDNALEHVTIRHTGAAGFQFQTYAVTVTGIGIDPGRLRMASVRIEATEQHGLDVHGGATLQMSDVSIDVGGHPARAGFAAALALDSASTYLGRKEPFVRMRRGAVEASGVLPALNVPYVLQGDRFIVSGPQTRLDIEPGAELRFEAGGTMKIDDATLSAIGTAEAPIRFVGAQSAVNQWQGIVFASASPDNRLSFVEISDAGLPASLSGFEEAAVHLSGTPQGVAAQLTLTDALISNIDGDGVRVGIDARLTAESVRYEQVSGSPVVQK